MTARALTFVLLLGQSYYVSAQSKVPFLIGPTRSFQNQAEYSSTPEYYPSDDRLGLMNHRDMREAMVGEAFDKAWNKIESCYPDVLAGLLLRLDPNERDQDISLNDVGRFTHTNVINGKRRFWRRMIYCLGENNCSKKIDFKISIEYCNAQRKADTYAEVILNSKKRTFPYAGNFNWSTNTYTCISGRTTNRNDSCDSTGGAWVNANQAEQEIIAQILIYPLAFNSSYFAMPTEAFTPYGAWSHRIEDTLLFLVLHEIGHVDFYIAQAGVIPFAKPSFSNLELDCDNFASSILKCVE
ncbi:MAG: hypothetical protein IPG35_00795 [Flavobacteriales bacterium]|nr:hypothetical protein [Flavobacteriales bacterium]MBK9699520.1 hypothetical protein [Flavobacteriales bacterium]